MKHLQFRNGDKMPAIGLGTWKSRPGEVYNAVREAIAIGYRHFDCAFIYKNEAETGQALADALAAGDVRRSDLWITSKLWNDCHGKTQVEPALTASLRHLQLDYLDLYLIHWPVCHQEGVMLPATSAEYVPITQIPLTETWGAMEACVSKGLTHHIGVSNFSIRRLEDISRAASLLPEANQIELHPYLQQQELVNYCQQNGIVVTAYSPLGSPDRPASMISKGEQAVLDNAVIKNIATGHGCSPAQVLIAWALQRNTSVIPKSVNPKRMKENLDSANIHLSSSDVATINALDLNFRYISGESWTTGGSPYSLDYLWG